MTEAAVSKARSVEELKEALAAGGSARFTFFWGQRPRTPGVLDQACLSQWFPATFSTRGETFHSAEQYMMWRKAQLFSDEQKAAQILSARSPKHVKALGRQVAPFDETTWTEHRWDIVVDASMAKFSGRRDLKEYLIGTRDHVLAEASPYDGIWGIGLAAGSPDAGQPDRWPGLNLLGFALMEARDRLDG